MSAVEDCLTHTVKGIYEVMHIFVKWQFNTLKQLLSTKWAIDGDNHGFCVGSKTIMRSLWLPILM